MDINQISGFGVLMEKKKFFLRKIMIPSPELHLCIPRMLDNVMLENENEKLAFYVYLFCRCGLPFVVQVIFAQCR